MTSGANGDVVIRELDPTEHHLLGTVGIFQRFGLPDFEHSRVIVAQRADDGTIVAYWVIFDAVHIEPLWIDENYRNRPGLARRLWTTVHNTLKECKVKMAFAMIANGDMAHNLPQAMRLGFHAAPGQLFFLEVEPKEGAPGEPVSNIKQLTEHIQAVLSEEELQQHAQQHAQVKEGGS